MVLPNLIEDEQDIRHRMHQDPVVKHSDEADGDPEPSDVITYLDYHKWPDDGAFRIIIGIVASVINDRRE